MHALSTLLCGLALLAGAVLATPIPTEEPAGWGNWCIDHHHAEVIANDFAQLISNYSEALANATLASDYTDQSDSVNTLIDSGTESPIPLGSLTFASKAAFLAGQSGQPNVPFQILDMWYTCNTVIIRWVSKQSPQQVQGIDALIVQPGPKGGVPWQIKTTYGEFNSGAWLADLTPPRPECNQ